MSFSNFLKKVVFFQKEHDLADEYFYYHMGENLGFTHNVSTNIFICYISVKSDNFDFDGDLETKKFCKLFEEHDLAGDGWSTFKYSIRAAPTLSEFDFEFAVYSKKS